MQDEPAQTEPTASAGSPGETRGLLHRLFDANFLDYTSYVIRDRAIPDVDDGLKPVQRRILYQMAEMGLRPDRGHVKSARVTGEVMGKLHPHGDGAIYDALYLLKEFEIFTKSFCN